MDEVQRSGISVTITKHRRPVARLVPAGPSDAGFCGSLAGSVLSEGDLLKPIDEAWDAE
jgi:antitoxin (DNA-binding transcriptional repressor) of toxin-antitoxin stability system